MSNQDQEKERRRAQVREAQARFYAKNAEKIKKNKLLKRIESNENVLQSTMTKYCVNTNYSKAHELIVDKANAKLLKDLNRKHGTKNIANYDCGLTDVDDLELPTDGAVSYADIQNALNSLIARNLLAESTVKGYIRMWAQLIEWLHLNANDITKGLKDPPKVEAGIVKALKKAKRQPYAHKYINVITTLCYNERNALPAYCNDLLPYIDEYRKIFDKHEEAYKTVARTKTLSDEDLIPWTEIEKSLKWFESDKGDFKNSQNHLIVAMYNAFPLRDDFNMLKLLDGDDDPPDDKNNYFSIKQKRMYLRKYKTAKLYGDKVYKVPQKIINIAAHLATDGRTYLIEKVGGGKTNKVGLGAYKKGLGSNVGDAFDESGLPDVTINKIRHSKVSSVWNKKYKNDTEEIKAKQDMAKFMLHSYETAGLIYNRKVTDD